MDNFNNKLTIQLFSGSDKTKSVKRESPQSEMIKEREQLFDQYIECMKTNDYKVKECDYIIEKAKGNQ